MSMLVYVLAVLYSIFMVFIILIYGIKFEQDVAVEWLVMCGWTTFLDIFIQQPATIFFVTFIGQFDLGCFGDVLFELVCCGP